MVKSASGVIKKNKSEDGDSFTPPAEKTWKKTEPENEIQKTNELKVEKKLQTSYYFGTELQWIRIIIIAIWHIWAIYFLLTCPFSQKKLLLLYSIFLIYVANFGVTAGAHRLWTHRAYKAKWPLQIILLCSYCLAGQYSLYNWVRDHRTHHKYSETDADPHSSSRGFFFSHVGWLMMKKHPEVIKRGSQVDMSDIVSNPILAFGNKYFTPLKILLCFVIPMSIPVYLWNEEWKYAISSQIFRYVCTLHCSWSVNSFAHIWGNKPYNKNIAPAENKFVAFIAQGEGWHNYHHAFPWDYKAAELGTYGLNFTTALIDMFAIIGWAYDLKEPSKQLISTVIEKHGDGSHSTAHLEPVDEN